jgi:hypothetical protein
LVENPIDHAVEVGDRAAADVDLAPDARHGRFCCTRLSKMLDSSHGCRTHSPPAL